MRARVEEPAPQIRRVHQLVALTAQPVEQGLAVLADFAADARLGGVVHDPADDDDVARHLGPRVIRNPHGLVFDVLHESIKIIARIGDADDPNCRAVP